MMIHDKLFSMTSQSRVAISPSYLMTNDEIHTLKQDYKELNSLQWNALSMLLSNLVEEERQLPDDNPNKSNVSISHLTSNGTKDIIGCVNANANANANAVSPLPSTRILSFSNNQAKKNNSADSKRCNVIDDSKPKNIIRERYIYSSPCHSIQCQPIQESSSSLLAARVLAKAGFSNLAWEILKTLFDTQGTNGFLPKYRYSITSSTNKDMYVPGTNIPSHHLFGPIPLDYISPLNAESKQNQFITSGRISSPPFHASIVLDIFYLSNQTYTDVDYLQYFSEKLYNWHSFLHEIVMTGCVQDKTITYDPTVQKHKLNVNEQNDSSYTIHGNHSFSQIPTGHSNNQSLPCYNIIHPWESMIDSFSPIWDSIFSILNLETNNNDSRRKTYTPDSSNSMEENDFQHNVTVSLLECLSNVENITQNNEDANINYEIEILQQCPFAMLDVGYASALAKSDQSLLEINQILRDVNYPKQPTEEKMDQLAQWLNQSQNVLDSLWNEEYESFLSNLILPKLVTTSKTNNPTIDFPKSIDSHTNYDLSNTTEVPNKCSHFMDDYNNLPLPIPITDNFMILYGTKLPDQNKANTLSYQMLQAEGNFSFNCGLFPLYSRGGCNDMLNNNNNNPVLISPMYNYWISKGLDQNDDDTLAFYIQKSTINMICNLPNVHATNISTSCMGQQNFAHSYDAHTYQPLRTTWNDGNETCWNTSTLTAAIVYDILTPDQPFTYESAPPISNGWVFTLIAIELFIAFTIGVSCVVLSLNLLQRLKDDNEADAFVRLINYERADVTDIYGADTLYSNSNGSLGSDGASHEYYGNEDVVTKISSMTHDNNDSNDRVFPLLSFFSN